ncbi:MAG: NifU family protein [Candidatus Nezhaarchaeota archaeon]|nr:NifU family protein [Candidatus Nezhaarchaeota archaeon]
MSEEKVKEVLRSKVDPYLAFEGGSVELVSVEGGRVKVRLSGACAGCPMRQFTIKRFIEAVLKREVPEVRAVEAVEEGRPTQ